MVCWITPHYYGGNEQYHTTDVMDYVTGDGHVRETTNYAHSQSCNTA